MAFVLAPTLSQKQMLGLQGGGGGGLRYIATLLNHGVLPGRGELLSVAGRAANLELALAETLKAEACTAFNSSSLKHLEPFKGTLIVLVPFKGALESKPPQKLQNTASIEVGSQLGLAAKANPELAYEASTWTPKVCRRIAVCRFWAIMLPTFGGLGNSHRFNIRFGNIGPCRA